MLSIARLIKVDLNVSDIHSAFRIQTKSKTQGLSKPVIVKLISVQKRDEVISAVRKKRGFTSTELGIRGSESKIYVNEHLTANNRSLFMSARTICKDQGFRYVWVRNGKTYIRKNDTSPPVHIRSTHDLDKLRFSNA